jgi:hypothetical protein
MQLISLQNNKNRIQNSFERICSNCDSVLLDKIQKMPLIVTDNSTAPSIYFDQYNLFSKIYLNDFGASKGCILFNNKHFHLVVLNIDKINEFGCTDSEFDGIFSHELGHIFNENPRREKPSVLKGNTKSDIDIAHDLCQKEKEMYADYFSKQVNCSEGLISVIHRLLLDESCSKKELFRERLEQLTLKDILLGTVMVINK